MSSIKANPIRWVWDQAKRAYNRLRGTRIDQVVEPLAVNRDRYLEQERQFSDVGSLVERLYSGDITVQEWQLGFRKELKDIFFNQYRLGKGGTANMTQADYGRLGGLLKQQYRFMDRFGEDLKAGRLSELQAKARAEMYVKAGRNAFERGKRVMMGMPDLPAYPGDGQTQCLSNCQCSWEIHETEEAWLATWTLGPAEHCPDCMDNSNNWAPLRLPKVGA